LHGQLEKTDFGPFVGVHTVSTTEQNYNGFTTLATSARDVNCKPKLNCIAPVLISLDERLLTVASLFGHLVGWIANGGW
jgi:hypothetical protein